MALLTDEKKFKRERKELELAWQLLRKIPEYIQDFEMMKSFRGKNSEAYRRFSETCEIQWGFYPLADPKDEKPSFELMDHFSVYSKDVSRFNSPVDFGGLMEIDGANEMFSDRQKHSSHKLKKISVEIDIEAPLNVILQCLKEELRSIQKAFGIITKNTRTHDHLNFLVIRLKSRGLSNDLIRKRLSIQDVEAYFDPTSARDKRINRRLRSRPQKL